MIDPSGREVDVFDMTGGYVAFLGVQGGDGMFVLHPGKDWVFHRAGTLIWDDLNQGAYRNFRFDRLNENELKQLGVSLPKIPRELPGPVAWQDNLNATVHLSDVPAGLLRRLRDAGGALAIHVVLREDLYETGLGDGKFLYAVAAFRDPNGVSEYIAKEVAAEPAGSVGCKYSIKRVDLRIDADREELRADLRFLSFEHCSIDRILKLLAP